MQVVNRCYGDGGMVQNCLREERGLKGQRKGNRSKMAVFLFLPLPSFRKGYDEKPWANLRNVVLSLTTPFPWKIVCQCCRNPSLAVQFAQTSPMCILGWPLKGSTYALVTTRLRYCNSFSVRLAAQLHHCTGESWECTPTSLGWIAVIKLPLCLLYVGSLKKS